MPLIWHMTLPSELVLLATLSDSSLLVNNPLEKSTNWLTTLGEEPKELIDPRVLLIKLPLGFGLSEGVLSAGVSKEQHVTSKSTIKMNGSIIGYFIYWLKLLHRNALNYYLVNTLCYHTITTTIFLQKVNSVLKNKLIYLEFFLDYSPKSANKSGFFCGMTSGSVLCDEGPGASPCRAPLLSSVEWSVCSLLPLWWSSLTSGKGVASILDCSEVDVVADVSMFCGSASMTFCSTPLFFGVESAPWPKPPGMFCAAPHEHKLSCLCELEIRCFLMLRFLENCFSVIIYN